MLTLFHAPRTRSSRILWLLEELGADYEVKRVSIVYRIQNTGAPDPANPHPDKQVPALLHDGTLVTESIAIVIYLADLFPAARLAPAPTEKNRGPYLAWLAWYIAAVEPALFAIFSKREDEAAQAGWAKILARVEEALARGPYLLGSDFTGADILYASTFEWVKGMLPLTPAIEAYAARCAERPAAVRAKAKD
jgi:glutathione S-transferase